MHVYCIYMLYGNVHCIYIAGKFILYTYSMEMCIAYILYAIYIAYMLYGNLCCIYIVNIYYIYIFPQEIYIAVQESPHIHRNYPDFTLKLP